VEIAVVREADPAERRVALGADGVRRMVQLGHGVRVEAGAGAGAWTTDAELAEAGGQVSASLEEVLGGADVLVTVGPPERDDVLGLLASGTAVVGMLAPLQHGALLERLAAAHVDAFSLELVPRITRAQAMDVLSSQAMVAGYAAALRAAAALPRLLPMMVTAAGTLAPAKVLVLGAGVAGLQAIATARRLGAVVSAYDVRPAAADEVRSLGARFLELPLEAQEGSGGYARAQSEAFLERQRALIGEHVAESDAVITTAAVPGRKAPVLVTAEMVESMRPGSVLVDLAAESGGNCELSRPGETVEVGGGVRVIGARNLPGDMALHASQLYGRNLVAMVSLLSSEGRLAPRADDEIVDATWVVRDGQVTFGRERSDVGTGAAGTAPGTSAGLGGE
jgi:NAD(P) transhydrogenase subunit alpha